MDVKSPPEQLSVSVSRAEGKVALDIDDAPFLVDESKPAEVPATTGSTDTELTLAPETAPSLWHDKKKQRNALIAVAVFLGLLCAGIVFWWFVVRTPPPPPVALEPEIVRVQSLPKDAHTQEFVVEFAPFWVEFHSEKDGKGGILFLTCKFAILTQSDLLVQEAKSKMPTLRDAIYYYLKNKPYSFLLDPDNVQSIKTDIGSVLNGYLVGGKIEEVLFESYLGK